MSEKDGGPAFPGLYQANSMTLRDYFAGQAMLPLIASTFEHNARTQGAFHMVEFDEMAAKAYVAAAAMLKARVANGT